MNGERVTVSLHAEALTRAATAVGPVAIEEALVDQRPGAPYVAHDPARTAMQLAMGATVTGLGRPREAS